MYIKIFSFTLVFFLAISLEAASGKSLEVNDVDEELINEMKDAEKNATAVKDGKEVKKEKKAEEKTDTIKPVKENPLIDPASGVKIVISTDDAAEEGLQADEQEATPVKLSDDAGETAELSTTLEEQDSPTEDEEQEKRSKMNNYKKNFAFACPNGRSISTLLSAFHPSLRDRSWSGRCDKYLPRGYVGGRFWTTNYGYDNEYRGTMNAYCPPQSVMTGLAGYWHQSYYDRRYKLYCTHVWHHKKVACKWSGYMNNWRESAHFTLNCNEKYYVVGMQAYYHTSYYDRRFRVYMCKLQKI
jgi:hypothetical protein